jgi:hypothetical protein
MRGDGKGRGDCDDRGKSDLQITMRVHARRTNQCKHITHQTTRRRHMVVWAAEGGGGTSLSMIDVEK